MTMESTGAVGAGTPLPRAPSGGHPQVPAVPGPRSGVRRRARVPQRRGYAAALVCADCLAAAVPAVTLAPLSAGVPAAVPGLAPALLSLVALHAWSGLYRAVPLASALAELPRLVCGAVLAWSVATTVLAVASADSGSGVSRTGLLSLITAHLLLECAARGAVHLVRRRLDLRRPRSALVVGGGSGGRRLVSVLHAHPEYGLRPVGLVGTGCGGLADGTGTPSGAPPGTAAESAADAESAPRATGFEVPVLGSTEDITRAVIQNAVHDAVLTRPLPAGPRTTALLRLFAALGCTVWLVGGDGPHSGDGPPAAPARWPGADGHLWGFPCRRLDPPPRRRTGRAAKRVLDVVLAAVALAAAAPLLLACALAVRIVDGPGVLFRQERVGVAGRPFVMFKFRTLLPADEHESATLWNIAHDRRMSGVGRLLRRTSLDELPQLWNVLRGDMSLVGPRPERPHFVQQFSQAHPGYAARDRMPAGITGLAQVHGLRGDTSIEDRARFDNLYIDTWSFWQDVLILLRTAGSVFRPGGS